MLIQKDKRFLWGALAMALVVMFSNILVAFPLGQ
jgi:uncharacterized PurR-regulated membrane protein YhhQ (DUF165 family)